MLRKKPVALLITLTAMSGLIAAPSLDSGAPKLEPGRAIKSLSIKSRNLSLSVNTKKRSAVVQFYRSVYLPAREIKNGWTGSVQGCKAGSNSDDYQKATLSRINYFRAMAGLPADITFNAEYDAKALKAALIMEAQSNLSHSPPQNWRCWSKDGATGAGNSNIALGSSGPGAIDLYMADPGSGNYFAGHRRWILLPASAVMGSGSTQSANALWVFGERRDTAIPTPNGVPWPPAGYVPYQFGHDADYRWSFSFSRADFSQAKVSVTQNGKKLSVSPERLGNGYGENTLVWRVTDLPRDYSKRKPDADIRYDVQVSNVRVNGQAQEFKYSVIFIDPDKDIEDNSELTDETEPAPPEIEPEFDPVTTHEEVDPDVLLRKGKK